MLENPHVDARMLFADPCTTKVSLFTFLIVVCLHTALLSSGVQFGETSRCFE